jgi:coenzyme F420 biosynthesis associated uncharacterized protein
VPAPALVDWGLAERIGIRVASRSAALDADLPALQRDMEAQAGLAESLVTQVTGLVPAGPAEIRVVDRPAWVRANIVSFQRLLAPLVERWDERTASRSGVGAELTSRVAAAELGTLLGWMSSRVLGQYDLLLAGQAEAMNDAPAPDDGPAPADGHNPAEGDVVYLVGPNLIRLERRFGFPEEDFRLWVLLHELTHRAQFTGVPWLAPHFRNLVAKALTIAEPDVRQLAGAARALMQDRAEARRLLDEGGMMALVASPEQRATLNEIGGMMALLEGHGDVTMDRAGQGHVTSAPRFAAVLSARRKGGSPPVRLLRKLIGLEGKLNQYEQGEQFIAQIERVAGPRAVDACWEGPERLPSLEEIREPQRWLDRVGLAGKVA